MKTGYFDAVLSDGGKPIAATVTVFLPGTESPAVIYADKNGSTQKDNPFQTDAYGRFNFYATSGAYYDIQVSGTGITTYKLQNVSMSPVAFKAKAKAWRTSDQTGIADQTWVKLQLDQETDPGGNYDNVTNYRFTVPLTGYYFVSAQAGLVSGSFVADKRYQLSLSVGGAGVMDDEICPGITVAEPTMVVAGWLYLTAGQFLEVWFWHNAGQNVSIKGLMRKTSFCVHLLST